jgi:DNA invertase Pin-like site-specific DNA recombinase
MTYNHRPMPENRTGNPVRAVLYARVACEGPESQASVQAQIECCRAFAAASHGFDLVGTFTDIGPGSSLQTTPPGFHNMMRLVEGGGIDALIAYNQARLTRNNVQYLRIRGALHRSGVEVEFVAGPDDYDPDVIERLKERMTQPLATTSKRGQR